MPFQGVLDINDDIKAYWQKQYGSPPYGHAEESSLQSFSQRIGVNIQKAIELLKDKGIVVENKSQTLLQIAQQNSISPEDIHYAIKPKGGKITAGKAMADTGISFLGHRTLHELADMDKINLKKSLLFLQKEGFDATPQSRMREAANALGITPYELFDKLTTLQ